MSVTPIAYKTRLYGVEVTVTRSAGEDGAPVIFVDTGDELERERGPAIRIRLNDELVYEGVPYEPNGF